MYGISTRALILLRITYVVALKVLKPLSSLDMDK